MEIGRSERTFVGESAGRVDSACATHENLGVVLRVEVEEYLAGNHAFAEVVGAGQSGFFIYGEKSFERPVNECVVRQCSHGGSHAYAVVCAECGSFGPHPFAVDNGADGGVLKVEVLVV